MYYLIQIDTDSYKILGQHTDCHPDYKLGVEVERKTLMTKRPPKVDARREVGATLRDMKNGKLYT